MSSFSFGLGARKAEWKQAWREVRRTLGLRDTLVWAEITTKAEAKAAMVLAMRSVLKPFDLVIIDESHALKHGLNHPAARNRCMAGLLGPVHGESLASKLLLLSATPVETSYASLTRQAEVLGRDSTELQRLALSDADGSRPIARRHVIRRLQTLDVAEDEPSLTKNQYRREWRHGGVTEFDEPMKLKSATVQRLVLGVVQRNVIEALVQQGDSAAKRFLPSFQAGMLSSFESFGETLTTRRKSLAGKELPTHEGEQEPSASDSERLGLDSRSIDQLSASYRLNFNESLPHPKMDAVAKALAEDMARGEKSLVFVRRVRTVEELAAKVARLHDEQLLDYLKRALSNQPAVLKELQENYEKHYLPLQGAQTDHGDDGASVSFFGHFFRGAVEKDKRGRTVEGGEEAFKRRPGAWFRTKVLQARGRRWSTLLYDNYVAELLGGVDAARQWAASHRDGLLEHRRWFVGAKEQARAIRFELWQRIALDYMLQNKESRPKSVSKKRLRLIRELLVDKDRYWRRDRRGQIGRPEDFLGLRTLFTELRELRESGHPLGLRLWPAPSSRRHEVWLRERTLRREFLASTLRLGRPVVDLWISAVVETGNLLGNPEDREGYEGLLRRFLDRLEEQRARAEEGDLRWSSFRELAALADNHEMLMDVVVPELAETGSASELRRALGRKLAEQSPVLGLHGGSRNPRGLAQFLLPGFPHVLVCTDILGEGQDMHTFCAKVLHYGAASSASATEQRTGRIDRIRSLVHRRMTESKDPEAMLQVQYPHLIDTLEPVQFSRLYWRLDAFLHLMHEDLVMPRDTGREVLQGGSMAAISYRTPPTERLKSSFEVDEEEDL